MLLHSNIIGKGTPFVILHGFLGMSDNWKTLGMQFSEAHFQVHLLDQRNHGHSFHSEEFNYDVLVEDLKHYCEAHHLEKIILLGHSMGGKTAMLFATKYPNLVSKLIVVDISPRFYPVHHDGILNGLCALDFDKIKAVVYIEKQALDGFNLKPDIQIHKDDKTVICLEPTWRSTGKEIEGEIAKKQNSLGTGQIQQYVLNKVMEYVKELGY